MLGCFILLLVAAFVGMLFDTLTPGALPGGPTGAMAWGLIGATGGGYGLRALTEWSGLPLGPMLGQLALLPALGGAALATSWASAHWEGRRQRRLKRRN